MNTSKLSKGGDLTPASAWSLSLQNNYGTPPIELVRGKGARVWDSEGKKYLDFLAGIATNIL